MKFIIITLILLTNPIYNFLSMSENIINYEEYLLYCSQYNKEPSNFRYKIWLIKKTRIDKLNKKNNYKLGPTKFTDLTKPERKSYLTSKNPRPKPRAKLTLSKTRENLNLLRSKIRRRWESLKSLLKKTPQKFLSNFLTKNPSSRNWVKSKKVTPIKDQGDCGSCWAFAVAASIESIYLIKNNVSYDLSEQEMVDCADDMDCDGGWNDLAIGYVKTNGVSTESDYPYVDRNGSCRVKGNAEKIGISGFETVVVRDMEAFLRVLDRQPVNVGFQAEDDFLDYKEGVIDGDRLCGATREINHAVLAVGYEIDTLNFEDNYILFKNQWGTDWGEDGYFRAKFHDEKYTSGPCNCIRSSLDLVYPVLD